MTEQDILRKIQRMSQRTGYNVLGDDASVLGDLIVSTDQFIEGTHFNWNQMSPREIGYKGAIQALSDLAAMAAHPVGLLCSASWPRGDEERMFEVFAGIESACSEYETPWAGGDISVAPSTFMDFTVLGHTAEPSLKSHARAGDLIAVTGPLGSAHAGFLALSSARHFPQLIEAFRKPKTHVQTALRLRAEQALHASTDISDSLSKSLHQICAHSRVGARIDLDKIPRSPDLERFCDESGLSLPELLLQGGEDYQLLMTLASDTSEKVISDNGLCVIGEILTSPQVTYIESGKERELTEVGWDPFNL